MESLRNLVRGVIATSAVLCLVSIGASAQDQSSTGAQDPNQDQRSATGSQAPNMGTDSGKSSKSSKSDSSSASSGQLSAADKKFVTDAAQGGMAEVELGQLATQNAESQEVKDFGQRMVTDHTKANDQLKQIAEQKGVTLPSDLPAKEKSMKDKMSKLKGEQFDRAYMQHMVMDHKKDVAEFQKASTTCKDSDLKSFASQTLPTLQDHLKQAQEVSKKEMSEGHKASADTHKDTTQASSNPKQ
jgi:putative membrane protein